MNLKYKPFGIFNPYGNFSVASSSKGASYKTSIFLFDPLIFFSLIVSEFVLFRYGFGVFVGKKIYKFHKTLILQISKIIKFTVTQGKWTCFSRTGTTKKI